MALGRKKKKKEVSSDAAAAAAAPVEPGEATRSRSLLSYYLPVMVAAVVAIAVFTYLASWLSNRAAEARLERLTGTLAREVGQQVADGVRDRADMLRLLASRSEVVAGMESGGNPGSLVPLLRRQLPGVEWVAAVPASWQEEQVLEALSGSYAAADLFQSLVKGKKAAPAQVIRDGSGRKQLLLGVPVKGKDGRVKGALVAAFSLDFLRRAVSGLALEEAHLVVEQVVGGGKLVLAGSGEADRRKSDGSLKIPGTLWQVRYGAPARAGISWPMLLALVGGGALMLLLVTFVGYRRLARDCKADMGLMVSLVDATLKGAGSATPVPRLAEAKPAMELLARYAQATYTARKASRRGNAPAPARSVEVEETQAPPPPVPEAGEASVTREAVEETPELGEEQLPLEIFRSSVIRGRSGMELDEGVARAIGLAAGSLVQESGGSQVVVARDNRATSDAYASALVAGLLASGCDVIDLGEAPAPLLNYTMRNSSAGSGIMVTGGHNPPEYNGFKIFLNEAPLGEEEHLELRQRILDGRFSRGMGHLESRDPSGDYLAHVAGDIQLVEPLKVVVDGGNGVAGELARRLFEKLGCEVVPLFCEPDGGFPNHLPDPSDVRNLEALSREVRAQGAHMGVALDVDGDAFALVDEQGRVIPADLVLMALAGDIIRRNPGADVIYDVAGTAQLPEFILSNGGRPIMWRTGHARMQAKLKETGGLLAGEFTGHIYINDRWYGFDDGIYAAARLMELFSLHATPASQLFDDHFNGFVSTPLLVLEVPAGKAEQVVRLVSREADFGDADVIDLDGLRVEYEKAWGLVRASTTRSALVFRFEATEEAAMEEIKERFRGFIRQAAPELELPF